MNKELKTENQVLRTKYNGPILELKNVRQYFQSGWGRGKVVVKAVHNVIQAACKEKIERDRRRGILNLSLIHI